MLTGLLRPIVLACLLLLFVDSLLWLRFLGEYRYYRRAVDDAQLRLKPERATGALTGYSVTAQRVLASPPPPRVRLFAAAVLRKNSEGDDVKFWEEVAAVLKDPTVLIIGCCVEDGCAQRVRASSIPVLAEMPYRFGRAMGYAAANGRFLVLDKSYQVIADPSVGSVSQVVEEIRKVISR